MAYVRRRSGPVRHMFIEDPEWEGYCARCRLAQANAVHDVPDISDEQREHESRRLGEEVQ